MNTQQFFKGLFMLLVTAVVTAFGQQPINYPLLGVTAVSIILTYSGKNLIAVLHSDSPVGSLSWINLASGLLVALGAGILESVGLYLVEGAILWDIVWKVVLASAFTYLGSTFFAPQHSVAKVRGFISPAASRSLRKASMMLVLLFAIGIVASAQRSPWDGFTKKITPQLVADNAKAPLTGTSLFRFDVGLTCPSLGLKTNEEGKITGVEGKDFSKLFAGIIFTHVKPDGFRDWGVGGGITAPYGEGHYGAAALVGYSVFRVGINVDFGVPVKQGLSLLGGITVDLFNLTE